MRNLNWEFLTIQGEHLFPHLGIVLAVISDSGPAGPTNECQPSQKVSKDEMYPLHPHYFVHVPAHIHAHVHNQSYIKSTHLSLLHSKNSARPVDVMAVWDMACSCIEHFYLIILSKLGIVNCTLLFYATLIVYSN